jgi:hypothetical protein
MKVYEKLRQTTKDCKWHVIFVPKCPRKVVYGQLSRELGRVLKVLAGEKEGEIIERHLNARPHAHAAVWSAEVCGGAGGGIHQRQECDPHRAGVCRAEDELRRPALLGGGY